MLKKPLTKLAVSKDCPRCGNIATTVAISFGAVSHDCHMCGYHHATPGSTMSRDRQLRKGAYADAD